MINMGNADSIEHNNLSFKFEMRWYQMNKSKIVFNKDKRENQKYMIFSFIVVYFSFYNHFVI